MQENSKEGEKQNKKWDVLRDDFMMGASMKDWDKTNESEMQEEKEVSDSEDDDASEQIARIHLRVMEVK